MVDEARLQRMLDSYEIRELAHRYAVAATAHDIDTIASLFDPEVDNGRWGPGREGVRAFYRDFFERDDRYRFMQVGTHQVDLIDDASATGICFTRSWNGRPDARGWHDSMVVYFDTYCKRDEQWGFVHRRETLHHRTHVPHEEAVIAGVTDGSQPPSGRDALPRLWDYWARWAEKSRGGAGLPGPR
jgi:SnoaL-like domain